MDLDDEDDFDEDDFDTLALERPAGVRITVDSGAAASVLPADMATDRPLRKSSGAVFRAANGGRLVSIGTRSLPTEHGNLRFDAVQDLVKPLLSVSELVKKGHSVIFAPSGAYIKLRRDKQRTVRWKLELERGVYVLNVPAAARDFQGQAQRP